MLMLCCVGCTTAPKPDGKIPVTTASEEARADFLKGRALADNLRRQEARPLFEEALRKDPAFTMAHVMLSTMSNSAEEFFVHVKAAAASAPKASEGERLLVEGFEAGAMGNIDKRGEAYRKLVQMYPEDERAHQLLGIHLNGIQDHAGAVAELKKAAELQPGFAPAYNQLGYALRAVENNAEAEAAFRKYIELVPNEPNPYDSLAELLMATGRFDESIAQYRKALSINEKFGSAHRGIAANLTYQGKHADAIAELQKLHDSAANDTERMDALNDMAIVLVDEGNFDAAMEKLAAAQALGEKLGSKADVAQADGTRGQLFLHLGKSAEAKAAFERANSLMAAADIPDQMKRRIELGSHGELALLAAMAKDFATAEKELETLRAGVSALGNPNQMRRVHEIAGMVALHQQKWDDAIAALKQANQRSPYTMYQLARAYSGKGDKDAAKAQFAKAANANTLLAMDYAVIRKDAAASAK
jgi:tetratricopeptide (TPR) repeat protein